jgi:hypothetical protein
LGAAAVEQPDAGPAERADARSIPEDFWPWSLRCSACVWVRAVPGVKARWSVRHRVPPSRTCQVIVAAGTSDTCQPAWPRTRSVTACSAYRRPPGSMTAGPRARCPVI